MRSLSILSWFAIVTLVLSASAFAKDNHSGSFNLDDTVRIGSIQLPPGHYKAEWSGPANDVKISILQNGRTVATTEGQIKSLPARAPYNAVLVKGGTNHLKALDEIEFNNRTEALQFAN